MKREREKQAKGISQDEEVEQIQGAGLISLEVASIGQVGSEQHEIVHLYFSECWGLHGLFLLAKSGSDLLSNTASMPCVEHLSMGP